MKLFLLSVIVLLFAGCAGVDNVGITYAYDIQDLETSGSRVLINAAIVNYGARDIRIRLLFSVCISSLPSATSLPISSTRYMITPFVVVPESRSVSVFLQEEFEGCYVTGVAFRGFEM